MRQTIRIKFYFSVTVTALLCTGMLTGCANPQQQASDAARTFVTAAQDGDQVAAGQVLTVKARGNIGTSMNSVHSGKNGTENFTVGEGEVTGDTARVPVTFTDEDGPQDADLHLRREDGRWRVYAITLKSGFGPTLNLDFEHPENVLGEAFHTAGQTLGVMARGFEQGAKGFEAGFNESYGQANRPAPQPKTRTKEGNATIEEVPSPPASER